MTKIAVRFRYLTGLKRDIFRNARLAGSWDSSGRFAQTWSEMPMTPDYRTRVSKIIALTRIPPDNLWIRLLFRNEQRRPFARTIVILPDNERDDLGAILSQGDTGAQQSANTQKER